MITLSQHSSSIQRPGALLPEYERMVAQIQHVAGLDEIRAIRDEAKRREALAHQAQNYDSEHLCFQIRATAARELGKRLDEMAARRERERRGGDRRSKFRDRTLKPTLADLGTSKSGSYEARTLARIPDAQFHELLNKKNGPKVTMARLIASAAIHQPRQSAAEITDGIAYEQDDVTGYRPVTVHFRNRAEREEFRRATGLPLTERTRSVDWYCRRTSKSEAA